MGWFVDAYNQDCASKGCLDQAGIHGRIGVLSSASIGLLQPAMALSQILVMDLPH